MLRYSVLPTLHKLEDKTGQRWSYRAVARESGLAVNTLIGLADGTTRRADLDTLAALLEFFRARGVDAKITDLVVESNGHAA